MSRPAPSLVVLLFLSLGAWLPRISCQPPAPGGVPEYRVGIGATDPGLLLAALRQAGYDALPASGGMPGVEVIASAAELQALSNAGYSPLLLETAAPLLAKLSPPEGGGIPMGYHMPAAIDAMLAMAEATWPSLAMVVDAAQLHGPGATFEGRPLPVIKISDNVQQDEDEPNVLFVGCHHAREIVTPEICLDLIGRLLAGYGTDPQITAIVDANEIWIAPFWNPDGLNHVWTVNNLWRKNRKPEGMTFGVDQNRNYLMGWDGPCGGSQNPSSQTYRGLSAGSEEETQTMLGFARDRRFAKVIDYHSFGREVLTGYDCSTLPGPVAAFIDAEATGLAQAAAYSTRDPSAEGEHQIWEIQEITSYAFLVEVHASFQPDFSTVQPEADALWPLELAVLQKAIPLSGHVVDAVTGLHLEADIQVQGIAWQNGETRRSESRFGRYHLWLPAGTWTVTFQAPGYLPQTHALAITPGSPLTHDVMLTPGNAFAFTLATGGGGLLDLQLGLAGIPPGTSEGYVLFSFLTAPPQGQGPLAGIWPDLTTLQILQRPPAAGDPLHWTWPVTPPLFPAQGLQVLPGGLPFQAGTMLDGMAVALDPLYQALAISPVVRLTF